jgi:DNA-binding transcriptional ArsR family regulator
MDIFQVLAEPTRREIVEMLAGRKELTATAIAQKFRTSPPAISQHLKVLKEAEVVWMQKQGQKRLYQLNPKKMLELEAWANHLTKRWNERFDALDKLLVEEKKRMLKNFDQ